MIDRQPWFERRFAFDLPISMFPVVIERLRGTPARLEDLVRGLPRDLLTRRDVDRWSIQENAGHLLDLEPLWEGRLEDFLAGREELRAADLQNRDTWQAGHNDAQIAGILAAFRTARARTVARMESLPEDAIGRMARHPRLDQKMRLIDAAFFTAEHDDHHLARISELRRVLAGRATP
jgi:uncharacterized damage-inducible protein DinB